MSRGIHTKPISGQTQTWLTPLEILRPLGTFDLDPCCPRWMPWRTAKAMLSNDLDGAANREAFTSLVACGLRREWFGRVFLNPPYSAKACMEWLTKLADHGDGVALVASRTETEWFHKAIWERADAVLFLRGRVYYCRQDGSRADGNAGHGSALVAYGNSNVEALSRSGLEGYSVRLALR